MFVSPQHLLKTVKKSTLYATYLMQLVVLFSAPSPAAMTRCSEDGYSQQHGKSYFLLMKPITINDQLDKYSPGNKLISYHEWHFSAPKPRNGTSSHGQPQVFSNSWFLPLATPSLMTALLRKVPHTHTSALVRTFTPSCLSHYKLKSF